jgi:hypothetical protein
VNYGLAAITVCIFLFDHCLPVTRLTLLDDSCTIPVAITIFVGLADRDTSSNRTHANTNIIRKSRRRNNANYGGSK